MHDALGSLIREKSYDSIAVQEILNRANVGRSTFYTHYRNKDQLLVSSIHDILNAARENEVVSTAGQHEQILAFSLPIFEHVDRHRRSGEGHRRMKGRVILHEHLRRVVAELIEERLGVDLKRAGRGAGNIPSDLLVRHLASTFVLVLNWWVQSRSALSPTDVNELFRALVRPTLTASRA